MSAIPENRRPLRVSIGEIEIAAASPLEARRLADALPAALDRALARLATGGAPPHSPRPRRPADRAAAQIADAIAEKLRSAP